MAPIMLKDIMVLEVFGEVIMEHIITTYLLTIQVEIPVWHQVQALQTTEIMSFTTGATKAVTVAKHNRQGNPKFHFSTFNIVANYYKPGPATQPGEVSHRIANPSFRSENDYGHWYIAENTVEGDPEDYC
jgi:hypothetical protein